MRPAPIDPNASSKRLTAPTDAHDADARTTTVVDRLRANARRRGPALVWGVVALAILLGATVVLVVYRRRGWQA